MKKNIVKKNEIIFSIRTETTMLRFFLFFFNLSGCVGPFGMFTYSLHLSSI